MAYACRFRRCYRKTCAKGGGVNVRICSIRVLVAIEKDYRAYRETIAACIHVLRPHVEVATASLDIVEEEIECFDPHVIISTLPAPVSPVSCGGRVAWVELSLEPLQPSVICIAGRYSERHSLDLYTLLEVIDTAERLVYKADQARKA